MDNRTEKLQVIKTVDEDGQEVELKLLEIVTVEGAEYALLLPADKEAGVVLMRMKQVDGEYIFETIEDSAEFEAVAEILSD